MHKTSGGAQDPFERWLTEQAATSSFWLLLLQLQHKNFPEAECIAGYPLLAIECRRVLSTEITFDPTKTGWLIEGDQLLTFAEADRIFCAFVEIYQKLSADKRSAALNNGFFPNTMVALTALLSVGLDHEHDCENPFILAVYEEHVYPLMSKWLLWCLENRNFDVAYLIIQQGPQHHGRFYLRTAALTLAEETKSQHFCQLMAIVSEFIRHSNGDVANTFLFTNKANKYRQDNTWFDEQKYSFISLVRQRFLFCLKEVVTYLAERETEADSIAQLLREIVKINDLYCLDIFLQYIVLFKNQRAIEYFQQFFIELLLELPRFLTLNTGKDKSVIYFFDVLFMLTDKYLQKLNDQFSPQRLATIINILLEHLRRMPPKHEFTTPETVRFMKSITLFIRNLMQRDILALHQILIGDVLSAESVTLGAQHYRNRAILDRVFPEIRPLLDNHNVQKAKFVAYAFREGYLVSTQMADLNALPEIHAAPPGENEALRKVYCAWIATLGQAECIITDRPLIFRVLIMKLAPSQISSDSDYTITLTMPELWPLLTTALQNNFTLTEDGNALRCNMEAASKNASKNLNRLQKDLANWCDVLGVTMSATRHRGENTLTITSAVIPAQLVNAAKCVITEIAAEKPPPSNPNKNSGAASVAGRPSLSKEKHRHLLEASTASGASSAALSSEASASVSEAAASVAVADSSLSSTGNEFAPPEKKLKNHAVEALEFLVKQCEQRWQAHSAQPDNVSVADEIKTTLKDALKACEVEERKVLENIAELWRREKEMAPHRSPGKSGKSKLAKAFQGAAAREASAVELTAVHAEINELNTFVELLNTKRQALQPQIAAILQQLPQAKISQVKGAKTGPKSPPRSAPIPAPLLSARTMAGSDPRFNVASTDSASSEPGHKAASVNSAPKKTLVPALKFGENPSAWYNQEISPPPPPPHGVVYYPIPTVFSAVIARPGVGCEKKSKEKSGEEQEEIRKKMDAKP